MLPISVQSPNSSASNLLVTIITKIKPVTELKIDTEKAIKPE